MDRNRKQLILSASIIAVGFAAVIVLGGYLDRVRPPMPDGYEDSALSMNGSQFRGFAFGMEGLIADWYYIRSLQYIGDKIVRSKADFINIDDLRDLNPTLLAPLLENATALDPHFVAAYSYGALVLPAIDSEKAIEFAKRGIANNPNEWRLYQFLGYIYWKLGRYAEASEVYGEGAQVAGAAPFMKMMSASMKTEGGGRETARAIYTELLNGSDDDQVQLTARRRLMELDSLDERDAIDGVLAEFKDHTGRCANGFAEILPPLMKVKLPEGRDFRIDNQNRPVDPGGAPYILDKEDCSVKLDREHTELPVK